jgi:hypothetical protein
MAGLQQLEEASDSRPCGWGEVVMKKSFFIAFSL